MPYTANEKPSLEDLQHYGVLGMKWGRTRTQASSSSVHAARGRMQTQRRRIDNQQDKVNNLKGKGQNFKGEEKKLSSMKASYLKNPDRVIAARMTRGEKGAALILGAMTVGGLPVAVTAIAGTSARSRRIERKQETGGYTKKK